MEPTQYLAVECCVPGECGRGFGLRREGEAHDGLAFEVFVGVEVLPRGVDVGATH